MDRAAAAAAHSHPPATRRRRPSSAHAAAARDHFKAAGREAHAFAGDGDRRQPTIDDHAAAGRAAVRGRLNGDRLRCARAAAAAATAATAATAAAASRRLWRRRRRLFTRRPRDFCGIEATAKRKEFCASLLLLDRRRRCRLRVDRALIKTRVICARARTRVAKKEAILFLDCACASACVQEAARVVGARVFGRRRVEVAAQSAATIVDGGGGVGSRKQFARIVAARRRAVFVHIFCCFRCGDQLAWRRATTIFVA